MTDFVEMEVAENEIETVSQGFGEVCLYSCELQVQTREFKGQVSGLTKCALAINCNSVDDFKHQLWLKINDKLKREVIFNDADPQWHENISPKEEDMDRFVLFYDSKSKRSAMLNKVNTITLNHWRSKEIWLYIHVYSTSVSNLTLWKKVQKVLIEPLNRDKAGANAHCEINALTHQLKEIHKFHYQSGDINWCMWANRIQASEPHLRETLLRRPPPAEIMHLFALARTSADDKMTGIRQNLFVADHINEGATTGLARIRTLVDGVRELQKTIVQLQKEQETKIELLEHEVATFETQTSTTRSLLNSMELVMPATETDFGRQSFQQIQDQDDVDHL